MRRAIVALFAILVFLVPVVGEPLSSQPGFGFKETPSSTDAHSLSDWEGTDTGTGLPLPGTIYGSMGSSATSVIDSTNAAYFGTSSPLGWSSEDLEAQIEHLSQWVDAGLINPKLDTYHAERWIVTDDPSQIQDSFNVPDGWTIVKNDAPAGRQHPSHGALELDSVSGLGYDGSMGWRFEANELSGQTLDPSICMYLSQQVSAPWREIYSAEITFSYRVLSSSVMDDLVFVFASLEGHISKYHVFQGGTPTDTWLQVTTTVPSSFFESLEFSDSLLFNIGLGTDFTGTTTTGDHYVVIDEIELRLQVRPFPEQIGLQANGALVTGSTKGSVSPYVPDGSNRDCYSAPNSNGGSGGVDLNGYSDNGALEVGADVPNYPDWSTTYSYQVGLQFPLYVPQGAAIESAFLEVEAVSGSVGFPGMRIFVADEDSVAAFTSGYPLLPDRYDWINASVYWRPTTWSTNGRYETPDLAAIIQGVVSRPGWQSGNYICVMIDYAYSNQQYAYNAVKGSSNYLQGDLARLFVDFIEPASKDTIPSFKFSKTITIDHTKVAADLQDFPVLVDIWDKDLHLNTQPDGDDIAFLYNGQVIPHELESYDKKGNGTHAHLTCWVNVPYLSSAEDTTLTMVYGDDAIGSQENPSAVWDSGFSAVWHLNDNPTQPQWQSTYADYLPHQPQIHDSSLNGLDGSTYGTMTTSDSVSGQIGSAIDLDGTNDYVDFGNPQALQMTGSFTVEAWFKADFIDNDYLVVKSGESNYRGWDLSFDNDASISPAGWVMFRYSPDGINTNIVGYERVDTGQWYHVVGVFCPSLYAKFYLNGELVGEETTAIPASMNSPSRPVRIGRRSDDAGGTSYMDTIVDEVRISSVARTDAWIKTEYNNQRNPNLFLTVGEGRANFRYMKGITIDHTKVISNLTGFPVLIDIYDSDLKTNVQPDGDDIMFVSNGRSLPHEIELFDQQYNSTHAHLVAWVRADLSSSLDTVITMYYSNPAMANQENPLEVWRNQYQGVWHLGDDPSSTLPAPQIIDSTYNGNDGTTHGTMTQSDLVVGHIGNALDFDGSNDYVDCGNTVPLTVGYNDFAMSVWFASTDLDVPLAIKGAIGTDAYRYMLSITSSGTVKAEIDDNSVSPGKITIYSASALNDGFWHYAVMVRAGSWLHLYIDGSEVPTSPVDITGYGNINSVEPFLIAACDNYDNAGSPNLFAGAKIDEVRVLHDTIGSEWILTEYNNQFDPSSFYSLGIEQEVIAPKEVPLDFMYEKDITIDHTKVTSDLNGFPVLIELYDTDLRFDVQADGDDIVFVQDGWILPYEIEQFEQPYNSSHAHLIAWVRLDLSDSTDTVLSMYYGNPSSESLEDPQGVWDTSFAAVWHLNEDPAGTVYDSTANNNDGIGLSVSSGPTLQQGKIDGCTEFYGETTKDRIEVPHSSSLALQSNMLVEAWVRTSNVDGTSDVIVAKWGAVGNRNYWLGKLDGSTLAFYVDNTQSVTASLSLVNDGYWHHVVGVANAVSGNLLLYVDGVQRGSASYSGTAQTGTSVLQIANNPNTAFIQEWDGRIDEVRVSSSFRSPEWIQTEYSNQKDPGSFFSVGPEISSAPLEFAYKKDITIDHTKVDADLNDFPLLIDIFDADLRTKVQSDGDDIIFESGKTILPHEIEVFEQSYNGSHAHLVAWVKTDLSSSIDTVITMYYGNPLMENQENPVEVWGYNYAGVWHLGESSGSALDSTSFGSSGSVSAGVTRDSVGVVGSCYEFNGANGNVNFGDPSDGHFDFGVNTFSYSFWIRVDQSTSYYQLPLYKGGTTTSDAGYECETNTAGTNLGAEVSDGTTQVISDSTPVTFGQWMYIVAVVDVGTNLLKFYRNGALVGTSKDISSLGDVSNSQNLQLSPLSFPLDGAIDEVHLVEMALSPDWIATEYSNQNDPTSFYTVGPETALQTKYQPAVNAPEFKYRKNLIVDHTMVGEDLTDFPMLVDIFDADLRTDVQADGDDIMFKSGYHWCPYEISLFDQTYNQTHAHLIAWVKTDLSASVDTTITMYYGNPDMTSQENPSTVWGDYVGVWHLDKSPTGTVYDSSQYNNDGITIGSMSVSDLVPGQVGNAFELDGIDDMINVSESSSLDSMNYAGTLSLWINWVDSSNDLGIQRILSTSNRFIANPTPPPNFLQVDGFEWGAQLDGDCFFYPWGGDGNDYNLVTNPFTNNNWHYLALTLDYSTKSVKMFLDGNLLALHTENVPTHWTQLANLGDWLWGGNNVVPDYQVQGKFDELRASNTARSPGWILTEFNNQQNPDSFYSFGTEEQIRDKEIIFTTSSESSVTIGAELKLRVQKAFQSHAQDFTLGTSFSITNGSLPIWTADVLVSPPSGIDSVSFDISYPNGEWWPFSVTSPSGIQKSYATDWTCYNGKLTVDSAAIDEYGMWQIQFLDRNHVLDTQMGPAGGPYSTTDQFSIGEDIKFRAWSSGTIGSTISLELTDPSGSTWYQGSTTFQGERFTLPYYHRKYLTISHGNVAEDLVNFPVLVDIYDTDLRTDVRSDGRDIAFAIGETTLSHEIETFDQTYNLTHAHLVAWVNVPLLSGSMDTVIAMYYGNPLAPIVYDSGPVWDPGYLGVWHLSESGTGALDEYQDSSQYKNNGQGGDGNSSYVPTQVAGKIGSGQDFNNLTGHYDFIDCGDSPLWQIDGYQITLEAWIQHDITPNTHVYGIMNHKGWYDGYALYINYGGGSTIKPTFALAAQDGYQLVGANDVTGGTWHHITATYDGSLMRIYVDGVQDPNVLVKTNAIDPSSYEKDFWIGHGDQPQDQAWSSEWVGQIDEVRVSNVVRSAGWIQTQFDNQFAPSSFYSISGEESIGYSESASINLDSSAPAGVWQVTARYSDANSDVNYRAGILSRSFTVKRGVSLSLTAPSDAISDGISSKLIGEQLYVEYELADTLTSALVSGATITMNWTVGGMPTNVQLNDYGDGRYGKTLNTSDLGDYGRWRIDLDAEHPFYTDTSAFVYLDLSHRTFITYESPEESPYGDDFAVLLTFRDEFDGAPLPGATIACNGTIVGAPIDYGNGTYLITIDSTGLSTGSYAFRVSATPSTSYLQSSHVDVQFIYRPIATDAYLIGSDAATTPWNQQAVVTIHWSDIDHSGIGIDGGSISINPFVQTVKVDIGAGHYNLTIDVSSYSPGTYFFDLTLSKTNYQQTTVTLTIIVDSHRTSIDADCESVIPVGTDCPLNLSFIDIDLSASPIGSGNLSRIIVDWGSGFQEFYSFTFILDTSGWAIGSHTINITVVATSTPRYYMDTYIIIELDIRKLNVFLSWDHMDPFPNGNDFVMYLHVNVSEPGSPVDGTSIDWLSQSYFSATNQTGGPYSFKNFLNFGAGLYELTIDSAIFSEGEYRIIVYVDFLLSENYTDAQTPVITFTYRPILTYLTSPDYPTVTTSYDTNVTITLSYVDIDHGLNISTGIITSQGASIVWQYVADGAYEVQIIVQSWNLGVHEVNLTADATGYQAKTITFQILVQIAYAYARSSESSIDLPVGDSAVIYADYWDITHDEPILGAAIAHDWLHGLTVSWTGTQYRIELPSLDTDSLGTYLVMFNFSKGSNYQFGYFNLTIVLRTHSTEFRLASAVEPTSYNAMVNVSVYCGDLDNNAGIVSPLVSLSVYKESGLIPSTFVNDTGLGNGYFIIRLAASNLGTYGVYELVIHFNWTGSIQKYYNRTVKAFVNIVGEASKLDLLESAGPTPYLVNMSYTYLYSELYSGIGISNSTPPAGNVFIYIQFPGESIDFSQVSIFEVSGYPGHYTIEFNSTLFGKPGIYTMLVFVNWSRGVDPGYSNRTDTVTLRIIPRSSVVTVTPPESTPFGVNATFTFSFDDVVDVTPARIANGSQMYITIDLPDYTLIYNTSTRQFHVSFNTSILGPPIGNRQFTISISWTGTPFYANVTERTVVINIRFRDTEFDCTSINPTPYGNNITLAMIFKDVTLEPSSPINDGLITLLNGSQVVPAANYKLSVLGNGVYELQMNTTYFGRPGTYQLKLEIATSHFYYAAATASRTLSLRYRLTTLVVKPVGETAYNSSLNVVFQYTDVLNYLQIRNDSTPTSIQILNGSSWLFSSSWRDVSEDYLLIVETYNQALEINREYVLWLRISYPEVSPYYRDAEAYVSFTLRERTTFLDLAEAPTPAPYLDYVNLTVFYGDLELSGGIAGATITLSLYGSDLVEGDDYLLQSTIDGFYLISINTTSIGPAGTSTSLILIASWTVGAPYYTDSSITLTLTVTQRGARAETLTSPAHVMFLENVSFTFRYIDEATEELIQLNKNQVSIYSGGNPLQSNFFSMIFSGVGYEISINSTRLGTGLVTNWNITVYVIWQDSTAPYYTDDRVSVWVTTINRVGMLIRDPVPTTPIGDNMSLSFTYVDSSSGLNISGATVVFDCLSPSGLVENTHFWVLRDGGHYTILVDTAYLGSIGTFSFSLRLLWSPALIPYYSNSTTILLQGLVRQIQTSMESGEPAPSTVPINDNVSVLLTYRDEDHGVPITGAELAFSVTYKTNTSGPATWSITPEGPGSYLLEVNCSDAGAIGTNTLIIAISFLDYQTTEIQVPFQIRERQGELNELQHVDPYYGETTSVDIQLTDFDADDAPIDSALLTLSWPGVDSPTWISLGNGSYRISLTTNGLESGLYALLIGAQKTDYFIPEISVPIEVRRISTEIIMPTTLPDVYWGDDISFWAMFNDTLHGVLISGAVVSYKLGTLNGLMPDSLSPSNYSITVDTGSLAQATSYIITITATFDNYRTATKQVTVNVLRIPLGLDIIGPVHPEKFKGEQLNITAYVNDTLHNVPLLGAIVNVTWSQKTQYIILSPVAGMNGYYSGFIDTNNLFVGDYVIEIIASRNNYITASTSLTLKINQIPTTLNLDALTSTYNSQTFNWSETIRIGVYILVPSLNTTGLSDCTVTWSLSGTTYNGQFQNGTLIGGAGYFYFDLDTWNYEATTYTMRITAYPNVGMFAYSTNTTILRINPIPTSVGSTYLGAQVWGWTGWVNLTYWDLLHDSGVHYADIQVDWEGNETIYNYLGDGIYEVFIDTSLVTPGIYPVSVNFLKDNHEGGTGVFTLTVLKVPTSIEAYTSAFNQIDGSPLSLEVPYGDVLPIILFYNDTWYCQGIPGATEMTAVVIGPSIPDKENIIIGEIASGNYSLLFDSTKWIVSAAPYRVIVSLSLSNWSRATISLDITIVNVPTAIEVEGETSIRMNYGQLYTVWVRYYDTWEGHNGEGVADGIINATSTSPNYVAVSSNQSDPSRPGWYEVILVSQRVQGSAIISIEITKANHERAFVSIVVAVEPSSFDILIEQAVIYGMPIGLILLIGAALWTRLFSVPKLLRHIRKMVKDLGKGKIPKPPEETRSRQQIIAELFNEITADLGISRTAGQMPEVSIPMEVPEIEGLLMQLSILTRLTPDELEDFKFDLTKMKLSEQVNFVKEVINQEAIKRARSERKTMEMVLEETAAQARSLLAGEEPVAVSAPEAPEEIVEPEEPVETEIAAPEPIQVEEDIVIDILSDDEIEEIRKKLVKAGIGKSELKTIIDQVRELPRDLVDELLKSVLGKGGEE
jgi:hypothetical protein